LFFDSQIRIYKAFVHPDIIWKSNSIEDYLTRIEKIYENAEEVTGQEGLNKIIENDSTLKQIKGFDEKYITISFFNNYKIYFLSANNSDDCYIFLGSNHRLISGKETYKEQLIEYNLSVMKNLSDKTRFRIIKFLLSGEKYGQEIADEIGISDTTVNYHMNYLISANLIEIGKRKNRVYHIIKKTR